MRCALVMPSWLLEDVFPEKTSKAQANYWQPLNMLYLGACLEREGYEVKFFDGSFLAHDTILERLRKFRPDFVGVYSNAFLWPRAKKTAEDIKEKVDESIHVTCGGPYPTAMGAKLLEESRFDSIVVGEGEIAATELAKKVEAGEEPRGVKGVSYRSRSGEIVRNPPAPLIEDLDSLPFPARHLLENPFLYLPPLGNYRRKPVAIVMTSRGCDARCIYCFQPDKERKVRYRSVENVMQEIEQCLDMGYREIRFLDDNFCRDYKRVMRICEEIKKRGLDFTWYVSARVNHVDKPLLKAMKDAGCWAVLFGIESGVQKNLNTLRKGITLDQVRRAVKSAKEVGLHVHGSFILGIPGETFEEGLKTIEFAIELDPDTANFHTLVPFPGTELYDRVNEYGRLIGDWERFTFDGTPFVPHTMSVEELERLRSIAFRRFYVRPRYMIKRLLKVRTADDLRVLYIGMKSLFWLMVKKNLFRARSA